MCDFLDPGDAKGPDPYELAEHRRQNWPAAGALPRDLAAKYNKVSMSGLPNALGVRVPAPSNLYLQCWDELFDYDD